MENPVPTNINKTKYLDDFVKEMLEENRQRFTLQTDDSLEKIQQKVVNVFGPLSRAWYAVEYYASLEDDESQQETKISVQDLSKTIDQTVLLLGQAFNAITYQCRLNTLTGRGVGNPRVHVNRGVGGLRRKIATSSHVYMCMHIDRDFTFLIDTPISHDKHKHEVTHTANGNVI